MSGTAIGLVAGLRASAPGVGALGMGLGGVVGGAATGAFGGWGTAGGAVASAVLGASVAFARFGVNDISPFIALAYGGAALAGSLVGSGAAAVSN
jgi:hypothetical protein